jgi:hypothetical protein
MFVIPLALLVALAAVPNPPGGTATVECTFSNPGYSGLCTASEKVSPKQSPRAACTAILSCLNDIRCTKTYCNASEVRSGWQLVSAKAADERR